MSDMRPESAVGLEIRTAEVLGSLDDSEGNCVEAEILIEVGDARTRAGKFTLELLTKDHFAIENMKNTFHEMDQPESFVASMHLERRPPFVLNDNQITDEVIREKFIGRVIKEDLAKSLWEVPDDDPDKA